MEKQPHDPALIEALRRQIARLEDRRVALPACPAVSEGTRVENLFTAGQAGSATQRITDGCGPLEKLLPEGGFHPGTLVEWLAKGEGSGATTLALAAAGAACRDGGVLAVLDCAGEFYPPAAARAGIDLESLIVMRAAERADANWALDQALRCRAVAAVLAWPGHLDGRTFRRLQLAAEEGGGLGLLIRPLKARHEPSWAEVRLVVEPLPAGSPDARRRLRIHLLRCRGGTGGRSVDVEIDDETRTVHPAARMAVAAARRHTAGA